MCDRSEPFAKQRGPSGAMNVVILENIDNRVIGPGLLKDIPQLKQDRRIAVSAPEWNDWYWICTNPMLIAQLAVKQHSDVRAFILVEKYGTKCSLF
jgi:hypothetical protein